MNKLTRSFCAALLLGGILAGQTGCQTPERIKAKEAAEVIDLRISGPAGMKFTGMLDANGYVQEIGGIVPMKYRVSRPPLTYTVQKSDGASGELLIEVFRGGERVNTAKTSKPFGRIHGEITSHSGRAGD